MPLSSALRFFGVWSGSMALAESRSVDVCLETIYGLNSGVFLSTLLHMPSPNQGVVWRSVQSVFTRLFTPFVAFFSAPSGCVHLYVAIVSPSLTDGLFFTPDGMQIDYEGARSRRLHVLTYGPAWTSTTVHILLFECP